MARRQQYTFWYGRGGVGPYNTVDDPTSSSSDDDQRRLLDLVQQDVTALRENSMITPLYIDGSGWDDARPGRNFGNQNNHHAGLAPLRKQGATALLQALGENSSVGKFLFQNATLDAGLEGALTAALAANRALEGVTFRNLTTRMANDNDNNIATQRFSVPATLFQPNLRTLHLSNVHIDTAGCAALARLLRDSQSRLTTLTLQNVQISSDTGEGLDQVLVALTQCQPRLKTLKLINMPVVVAPAQEQQGQAQDDNNNNNMETARQSMVHRWLRALCGNRSITTLHLEGMQLHAGDAPLLANLLTQNKTVQQLSLRRNLLTAAALRTMLFDNGSGNKPQLQPQFSLQRLYLSRNILGDASAALLAALIQQSATLKALCLVDCKLTADACVTIAQSLCNNPNSALTSISLDGNAFDSCDDCAAVVLQALEQHNHYKLRHVLDQMPALLARWRHQGHHNQNKNRLFHLWSRVDLLLRANGAQRGALPSIWKNESDSESNALQPCHLPHLLAAHKSQPDVLHYMLRDGGITGQFAFVAAAGDAQARMAVPPLLQQGQRRRVSSSRPRRIVPSVA